MEPKINIMIADDHSLVAKLLKTNLYFEPRFNIVSIAMDGEQVIEQLKNVKVDILLLDINMPKLDGIQVLTAIREQYSDLKIIMLSNLADSLMIVKALKMGANAYLTKFAETEEVKDAILKVMKGEPYFCKTSFQNLMSGIKDGPNLMTNGYDKNGHSNGHGNGHSNGHNNGNSNGHKLNHEDETEFKIDFQNKKDVDLSTLTQREKEVLQLVIEEKTTKEISEMLFISTRTVETHRKNIHQKLGVKSSLSLLKIMTPAN